MPKVGNPFSMSGRTYQNQSGGGGFNSPYAADISRNIGAMVLGGESPNQAAEREANTALKQAQTRKYGAEASEVEDGNCRRTDVEFFNTSLADFGVDPRLPETDIKALLDANPDLKTKVIKRMGSYRGQASLTGKTNYDQFQKGVTVGADRELGEQVLSGAINAGRAGESIAARDGKPLMDIKGDTRFSQYLSDAPMTTTEVGRADIGHKRAQANQANSAAGTNSARTAQIRGETASGISVGAPVAVIGADGRTTYASPQRSVGQLVGAKPSTEGSVSAKMPFDSGKVLDEEINAQNSSSGLELTPDDKVAIRARASELYSEVGNTTEAVRRARTELGYEVVREPGRFYGTNAAFKKNSSTPGKMVAPEKPAPVIKKVANQAQVDDAIRQANEAIKKGKDPAAVRARLQEMGIDLKDQ